LPCTLGAMRYFAELLDARIAVAEAPVKGEPTDLPVEEARGINRAVQRRRLEFATGRVCARRAMRALGHAEVAIPSGNDRAPIWPSDLVGSITHTRDWAAAAVARRDAGFVAIGIDLEPADALPPDLWALVCTPGEQAKLMVIEGITPGLAARLVFSMKEATFKCQYPLTRAALEFEDITIDIDPGAGKFVATFQKAVPQFGVHHRLAGRFAISSGHITSAVVITSEHRR
jgi:4'-phosphopantetheinyl transferase EntD